MNLQQLQKECEIYNQLAQYHGNVQSLRGTTVTISLWKMG